MQAEPVVKGKNEGIIIVCGKWEIDGLIASKLSNTIHLLLTTILEEF